MSSSGASTGDGANGVCLPAAGAAGEDKPESLQLLDFTVLQELEEDMGGSGVASAFAKDYIGIWNKRLGYLTTSVGNNEPRLAMDAVLSLKNSAFMVGASRLAKLALELECLIRTGDLSAVRKLLPVVRQTGEDTVTALRKSYLRHEP